MGILNNFETWARSDSDKPNRRSGFEPWAHRNNDRNWNKPSNNPAVDIDDASLYNPHSEYHNYDEDIDDIEEFDDL